MPRFTTIEIKLQPYLIRYICQQAQGNKLRVGRASELGNFIMSNLRFPPKGWRPEKIADDEKLIILFPSHLIKDCALGSYLNDEVKLQIATAIETDYWNELFKFVAKRNFKYQEKELVAIRKFRMIHNTFEDDYLEESAYTRYRRLKKKKKTPVISGLR